MSWQRVSLSSEEGVTAVETTIVLFVLLLLIMFTYELLKFQSNISLIYINEEAAIQRMDMALLNNKPEKLDANFMKELKSTVSGNFFNALVYDNVKVECYSSITSTSTDTCSSKTKIIKVSYQVKRLFSSKWLCDLASLPITLEREVLTVNDYYQ